MPFFFYIFAIAVYLNIGRGRARMVVGFTTLPVHLVPITTNVVSSNPAHGEVYSITTLSDKVCQ